MTTYRVLFSGKDPIGHINLWVTDGTSAETKEFIVAGQYSRGLFFQNSSGQVVIWELNGTSIIIGGGNVADPGPAWHV